MNIGVYLHTQTGRTAALARAIAAVLTKQGDNVETHFLRTEGKVAPRSTAFELKPSAPLDNYDLVIFGGPVWAFGASPVIMKFLDSFRAGGKLSGKKTACIVSKGLPFGWTGGSQALRAMSGSLAGANATVMATLAVNDFTVRNETKLARIAGEFAKKLR